MPRLQRRASPIGMTITMAGCVPNDVHRSFLDATTDTTEDHEIRNDISDSFDAMDDDDDDDDDGTDSSLEEADLIPPPHPYSSYPPQAPQQNSRRPRRLPMARILASSSPEITALCKNPYPDDCDVVSHASDSRSSGGASRHRRGSPEHLPSSAQIGGLTTLEKLWLCPRRISDDSQHQLLLLPSLLPEAPQPGIES